MPQMAPLSWITLYLFFSMLFILSCIMNFYLFNYTPKTSLSSPNKKMFSWKW
nr:ATP synthase F0 subunit 8 [Euwallacea similis]